MKFKEGQRVLAHPQLWPQVEGKIEAINQERYCPYGVKLAGRRTRKLLWCAAHELKAL